jgi:transcriptional regulator with XRE-family HTH domain
MPALPQLRRLRERAALTQEELAKESGVARTTILRLENGADAPYPSTTRKLAKALGVKVTALMEPES